MSKISELTAHTAPLAADDLIAAVDTGATVTKSIRADQAILYSKTTILTAAVLTLNGTPVELVAAPGAGKIILPFQLVFSIDYNSIAYTTNTTMGVIYDTGVNSPIDGVILLKTADHITSYATSMLPSDGILQNKKLSLTVGGGNPAAGNSPIVVYIYYQILTL